ncbi:MAG TPA: GNAT family N-acetyltransferase [Stellaceae bacterium]|nr:GNAT family N-acetyltransferase [Stellaceae bacterium]
MTQSVIARRTAGGVSYEVDTAKDRLDIGLIHHFLSRCSHWALRIPRETLERAIAHSLCFGLYADGRQIGFARVVSDEATYAYLSDVFVVAEHRNSGLGQFLIEGVLAHEPLQGLRLWQLVTRDAASLYRRCGFTDLAPCRTYLHRFDPDAYAAAEQDAAD